MQITKINGPALRKPRGWSEGGERGGFLRRTAFGHQRDPCCPWAPWNLSFRAASARNLSSDLEGSEAFLSSLSCGKAKRCPEVLGSGKKHTGASYGHLPVSWNITDFRQTPKPETEHRSMGAGHPQPRREREREYYWLVVALWCSASGTARIARPCPFIKLPFIRNVCSAAPRRPKVCLCLERSSPRLLKAEVMACLRMQDRMAAQGWETAHRPLSPCGTALAALKVDRGAVGVRGPCASRSSSSQPVAPPATWYRGLDPAARRER